MSGADGRSQPGAALESREAGGRVIRGGLVRSLGYAAGAVLTAAASVLLLRYLSVADFGRYVTVMSVVAIVGGLADAGLTLIGQREYATAPTERARRALLADLVALRLVITPIGVLLALLFGLAVGYERPMLEGIALAGAGTVLAVLAGSLVVPLTTQLRFASATAVELTRQAAIAIGIACLVAIGAPFAAFFLNHIAAGAVSVLVAVSLIGSAGALRPRFAPREWRRLLAEALPVAASSVVNVVYMRALVILMSVLASAQATGLFATSYRVVEVLVGVPQLMVGAAFPVLAHAGAYDRERLAYAVQRSTEGAFVAGLALAIAVSIAARPAIELLGGSRYEGAAPVLSIHVFGLVGAFVTQAWALALVSIRQQRALVTVNLVGLATVAALGVPLVLALGATGAALAAVVGELALAGSLLFFLVRADSSTAPDLRPVAKATAIAAVCFAAGHLLPIAEVAAAFLASASFLFVAWRLRLLPREVTDALWPGSRRPGAR